MRRSPCFCSCPARLVFRVKAGFAYLKQQEERLEFEHTVGPAPLVLSAGTRATLAGDQCTVSSSSTIFQHVYSMATDHPARLVLAMGYSCKQTRYLLHRRRAHLQRQQRYCLLAQHLPHQWVGNLAIGR